LDVPPRSASPPTGPHPVAEPLHRGALQLLRLLRREDAHSGVSPARLAALSVLVFHGPCTLGALAAAEQVSAPTMSRLAAELERDGWIARQVDPDDARRSTLTATAAARRLLLDGRARRLRALTAGLEALSRHDQRAIRAALPALEALVRTLAAVPARAPSNRSSNTSSRKSSRTSPRVPVRGARRRFD
jgi:DNA-binding MarR family transcriptional regulator